MRVLTLPLKLLKRRVYGSTAISVAALACLGPNCSVVGSLGQPPGHKQARQVAVADCISMTRFANSGSWFSPSLVNFSPDGKRFVVVLKKGNLQQNTVEYSLLLWRSAQITRSTKPEPLVSFSSNSNREGITDVRWLDERTVSFLGENPGEERQLWKLNVDNGRLTQLTTHRTSLVSYSMTTSGETVVFAAERPLTPLLTEGIRISTESLPDLISRREGREHSVDQQLFLKKENCDTYAFKIDHVLPYNPPIWLSPDGRYSVVPVMVAEVPPLWWNYQFPYLQTLRRDKPSLGSRKSPLDIQQYVLLDAITGASVPLLDGPIGWTGSEIAWSPDSRSVVVSDVYLPLDVADPIERRTRELRAFSVEILIPSRQLIRVSDQDLWLIGWDEKSNRVIFKNGRTRFLNGELGDNIYFAKRGSAWQQVKRSESELSFERPDVFLDEDSNTPPRIVAIIPDTHERISLLDLNPQFDELTFGKVEEIRWKASDGYEVKGGLYLPPDYTPGKRYPLVIQTHGFTPKKFWINGPWPAAFAAQPLASRGFVVLQAEERFDNLDTPKELPNEMSSYETAIDYLSRIGTIDRDRVGIIGFSRTCMAVKYGLAHSKYHFAAAEVADGMDAGYVQYIAYSNSSPAITQEVERINDARPFGEGLSSWLQRSPGFRLDNVSTPVLIQAFGPYSLLGEWEWFSGLSLLEKPVDLIYLPYANHVLVKPLEQMKSEESTVDWFSFWLKGEVDPDPAKAEQYARWRELRKLQSKNEATRTGSKQ